MQIGIDIGGSLTKVVTVSEGKRRYRLLEHNDAAEVAASIPRCGDVYATGCGAKDLAKRLKAPVRTSDELQSFCAGARQLVLEKGPDAEPFVLASMGTGTSIFYVSKDTSARAAGTGVGGGTITGLGTMLLDTPEFSKIMDLASQGQRRKVDLMVSDLYPDAAESPVLSALTAANFGRRSFAGATKADAASAIVQIVVETVAVLSIQVARTHKSHTIFVAGSPSSHPLIQERFLEIGRFLGHEFAFLENGAYCGALGAILLGSF